MSGGDTLDLVVALHDPECRRVAAGQLAARLGAEELLLLVRDPELGRMLPAPGLTKTLRGGRSWRTFLKSCPERGRWSGEVELPVGVRRQALGTAADGSAAVLLGGSPDAACLELLERLLPVIGALLRSEQQTLLARLDAAAAHEVANRVRELADALEAARAEASKLNAELRREHSRKDSFLAMLGHELRNPLAPLVTSLDLLRVHGTSPHALKRQLEVMSRQASHLSRLVEDLLDVSRVSRGQIELRRQPVDLAEVLQEALEEARPLLARRGQQVVVRNPEERLVVDGDWVRLVQVFGNLVNNAAKYTDAGGRISLEALREEGFAVVRVKDSGIGISSEMLPVIFDLFTQAPEAPARGDGGLGIGLTLVRTLVELHDGKVTAESGGPGRGSTFVVRLPLQTVGEDADKGPNAPAVEQAPWPTGFAIIVVDDNRDAADAIRILLRLMGHEARVAYDGASALALARERPADLMLVDIGLPGMNGYEVARRVREMSPPGIRLVALTGYGTDDARQQSISAGFDEHVVKPVSRESLDAILSRCAEHARAQRLS